MTSSVLLLEEFVSLIIVIGRSDVGPCDRMDGIKGIARRVEMLRGWISRHVV